MKALTVAAILLATAGTAGTAAADTTTQTLPHTQSWTVITNLATDDDWSLVPGWVGYRGDALVSATGVDPQTVVAEGTPVVNVNVDETAPDTFTTGGATEFELVDPVVALAGSGTADAPNLVVGIDTTGLAGVRVQYDLRDLDGSVDDAIQPVALQFRVGNTGDFTNIGDAFVADASSGPSLATLVTPVNVLLPAGALDQPRVELRWITTNAAGNDEWIGVDNVSITAEPTPPTAVGLADPDAEVAGMTSQLTATVTPGAFPTSTGITVVCDLTSIGGSATQALLDDGLSGDGAADDGVYGFLATITAGTAAGAKDLDCTVADAEARSSDFTIDLEVLAVCGDGVMEGTEECDDDDTDDGDGCSATCTVEDGYTCTGTTPSVCTDIDECADMTDDCHANADCTNIDGSFTCACATGFSGDGVTACDPVCGDALVVAGETCDDGGTEGDDGCSATCSVEAGWVCTGEPSDCAETCGDGLVVGSEECDDAGLIDGDGCDATCVEEPGWMCTGEPSTCSEEALCGDGTVDVGEECDDGNDSGDDGCDATCEEETGWVCNDAEPSECLADADGDLIADDDDNCPDLANPSQVDEDDDGIGDACDDAQPPGDSGCCSTSTDSRSLGGFALLALLTLVAVRRKRR